VVGYCEFGNEPSGSIKGGKYLEYVNDYQVFMKNLATQSLVAN
jgi:hypothetical protein